MQFRGGMNEIMRQAARIQRKMDQTREELKDVEVRVTSAGDKVAATATYAGKVSRIEVDPEFLAAEGLELTLDAVCAAVNGAIEAADKAMSAELEKATGGVKIPGLF